MFGWDSTFHLDNRYFEGEECQLANLQIRGTNLELFDGAVCNRTPQWNRANEPGVGEETRCGRVDDDSVQVQGRFPILRSVYLGSYRRLLKQSVDRFISSKVWLRQQDQEVAGVTE